MDLKKRIQSLEESMDLHERMKRQALAEFESYRQRVEDMQLCTEAQVRGVAARGSAAQQQVTGVVFVSPSSREPAEHLFISSTSCLCSCREQGATTSCIYLLFKVKMNVRVFSVHSASRQRLF